MTLGPFETWTLRQKLKLYARNRHRKRFWEHYDKATYECPSCGCSYSDAGREWEVHHKDRDALNGHIFNLVALCHTCHRHTHSSVATMLKIEEWKEGFLALGDADTGCMTAYDLSEMRQTEITEFAGGTA